MHTIYLLLVKTGRCKNWRCNISVIRSEYPVKIFTENVPRKQILKKRKQFNSSSNTIVISCNLLWTSHYLLTCAANCNYLFTEVEIFYSEIIHTITHAFTYRFSWLGVQCSKHNFNHFSFNRCETADFVDISLNIIAYSSMFICKRPDLGAGWGLKDVHIPCFASADTCIWCVNSHSRIIHRPGHREHCFPFASFYRHEKYGAGLDL